MKYTIRELRTTDIYSLHRMYDSLSEETKRYFHPGFLGLKSVGLGWFLTQITLLLSTVTILRNFLLRVRPSAVFLPLVGVEEEKGEIIAFAYLQGILAQFGIVVRDDFQEKGVGSKLMENLLKFARKRNILKVSLAVQTDNVKAIKLYKKYEFKKTITTKSCWLGHEFDYMQMELNLFS